MPAKWSGTQTVTLPELTIAIHNSVADLISVTKPALAIAVQRGEQLIKSRTPVKTGRLQRSWSTEETKDGFRTGNDAADPKTGFQYATTVELGLKRAAGPAYMIEGAVDQIYQYIIEELNKVS